MVFCNLECEKSYFLPTTYFAKKRFSDREGHVQNTRTFVNDPWARAFTKLMGQTPRWAVKPGGLSEGPVFARPVPLASPMLLPSSLQMQVLGLKHISSGTETPLRPVTRSSAALAPCQPRHRVPRS